MYVRADTHRLTPVTFHNTYSFAHPPVLRIKPGDRASPKPSTLQVWTALAKASPPVRTRRPVRSSSKAQSRATAPARKEAGVRAAAAM